MDGASAPTGEIESLFRGANELVEAARDDGVELAPYLCECWDARCRERVLASAEEYEAVRAHGRRFLVRPGHVAPGERVVQDARPRFLVIEKTEDAGAVAEELDPRA